MMTIEISLYSPDKASHEILEYGKFKIGYFIQKSSYEEAENQDSLFFVGEGDHLLLGVADGAGGHPKGKEASQIACSTILDFFKEHYNQRSYLLSAIEDANENILDLKVGARATIALAKIADDEIRFFSVGDSEILYTNSLGSEIYSNIPQSIIGHQIEAGVIDQEEALDAPDRNIVNNLLGDPTIRVEATSKMLLKKGHSVLVGSDGLFDNIPHQDLCHILSNKSFDESFEDIKEKCLAREFKGDWRKDDDISFIYLRKVSS